MVQSEHCDRGFAALPLNAREVDISSCERLPIFQRPAVMAVEKIDLIFGVTLQSANIEKRKCCSDPIGPMPWVSVETEHELGFGERLLHEARKISQVWR